MVQNSSSLSRVSGLEFRALGGWGVGPKMGPNSDNPPYRTFRDQFWLSHSALAATLPRPKPFATEV